MVTYRDGREEAVETTRVVLRALDEAVDRRALRLAGATKVFDVLRGACVDLRPQLSELTVSPQCRIILMMTSMMTSILHSVIVLALFMGISGCLFPRDWRGDRREYRSQQRYRDDRADQSRRDCWSRDSRGFCRDGE
jgi:hypothetical protein